MHVLPLKWTFGYWYIGPKVSTILGFSFGVRPKPKSWFRSLTSTVVGQTVAILMPSWQTNGSTYSHKRMHKKYTDFTK